MRLFDGDGARLYLTTEERARFLRSADQSDRETRMFCHVLHYTGGRTSEIADLTPSRIHLDENVIVLRTLKRKKKQFVDDYNHERYHESLDNLTPADVYYGRGEKILNLRAKIKKQTLAERRRLYYRQTAA